MTSTLAAHAALLPAVAEYPTGEKREPPGKRQRPIERERCPAQYMDEVLACIPADRQRNDGWRQVLGAFIDADVIGKDDTTLTYADKVEKLRKWSAGGATYDEAQFEADCDWFHKRKDQERSVRAGLGTVDALARRHGYRGVTPSVSAEWGPPLRNMADIAGPAPARQWAAGNDKDGWLPLNDVTLLYGPDGVGKTLLAGQIALAAARGEPLFGIPFQRMPALLIACEDDDGELHRRFEKQGRRSSDEVFYAAFGGYDTRLNKPDGASADTAFYQYLARALTQFGDGRKLLILDNLFQIYRGGYIEPAEVAGFINHYCRRLAFEHNATVIILAHPSQSQKQSGDGGYGGVGWSASVRNRLYFDYLRGDEGEKISDIRVLSRKKANYATLHEQNEGIHLRWDDWNFRLSTEEDVQFQTQVTDVAEAEAVLRYIWANDFAEGFSIAKNVTNNKRKLVSKKVSCNLGSGAYQLSAVRIRKAVEYLLELRLLKEVQHSRHGLRLWLINPHKPEGLHGVSNADELEALCAEYLGRGRKPPRDPAQHTPSEPMQRRMPQRRRGRPLDEGPFKPVGRAASSAPSEGSTAMT